MSHKKNYIGGIVYSTNPIALNEEAQAEKDTLAPSMQQLFVKLDTKHRAGKVVTLVLGFIGKSDDLEILGKMLKTKCGTGGSAKDGIILIQGDYKAKIIQLLQHSGYNVKH